MKRSLQSVLACAALAAAGHAAAQITLYEGEGFRGRAVTTDGVMPNLNRIDFNDRASSIVVEHGRWEVCEHIRFEGRCAILRRGSYPSLREIGFNNMISSVRPADRRRVYEEVPPPIAQVAPPPVAQVAPPPAVMVQPEPAYEYRRREDEPLFQVPVSSVHAVVGPPNQRCWIERQQVTQGPRPGEPNVGGALVGGLVGGILGHQVGGGSGKDLATAGGAVAGAVIGSNVANANGYANPPTVVNQDVQRCQQVPSTTPAYYDVTYVFRGVEHHVQMSAPPAPGAMLLVNGRGEPRQ